MMEGAETDGRRDKATAIVTARASPRARAHCQPDSVMETAAPAPHFFHDLSRNAPPIELQTWPKLSPSPNVRSRNFIDTHRTGNSRISQSFQIRFS